MNHSFQGGFQGEVRYTLRYLDWHFDEIQQMTRQYLTSEELEKLIGQFTEIWRQLKGGATVALPDDRLPYYLSVERTIEQEKTEENRHGGTNSAHNPSSSGPSPPSRRRGTNDPPGAI